MLERGLIRRMAVETLRDCLAVLEIRLDLVPMWRGADLGRLLDRAASPCPGANRYASIR